MANIDLTTYRKDELAERDWMDPCAEFYLASEVDNLIADKDRGIARLKDRKSPDIADALALSPAGKPFVDPGFAKKEPVEDTREAVAELKDKYCTHCVICGKPWGVCFAVSVTSVIAAIVKRRIRWKQAFGATLIKSAR